MGPNPMLIGSTPTSAKPIIFAKGFKHLDFKCELLLNTTTAAPSFIPSKKFVSIKRIII